MKEGALHELPGGWVWTRLEDASKEFIGGGTPSRQIPEYFGGNIIWLTPTEVPKNKIVILKDSKEKITESGLKHSSARIIPKDAVLLTSRASIGYVAIAGCDVTTNQGFASFVCSDTIYNFFLAYWLWANKRLLESNATGTTFKEISKSKLREFYLPLPPLPEQRAIVSKIEQLFSDLDNGINNFKKAQAQLKLYRQSVLKAACEGKLVPTEAELARAEGREYEAADVLLGRILKEKCEKSNGAKYREPVEPDTNGLLGLPDGWVWTKVGGITEKIEKVSPEDEPEAEFIYLDISSIDNRYLKITEPKKYLGKDAPSRAKQKMKCGDVLFSTVRTYLKNIAQVPSIYDGQIASTGFSILRPSIGVNENFLFYYVQTEKFLNPLTDIQRGTSYPAVRDGDVREQFFPLPPLAEQRRIVAEVERRLSVSDKMEETIAESLLKAESLRQSILKKAFEGKLLNKKELEKARNASDWEPAGKLLERIRQEKTQIGEKKRKR
ncbi:MAG: restriction endonuclease subunit S [Candidatus Methanoperedens sp.]|nr:restriction endonuclease subunit S [Candidatus Methanoperedens sp.]